ncbi:hypothetical protein BH23BAC3_BH23BAC3_20220 [soil metagenome]
MIQAFWLAAFAQDETLIRMFDRLRAHYVIISRFRADSVSYQKDAIEVVQANTERFHIRAKRSGAMLRQIGAISRAGLDPGHRSNRTGNRWK